jgi:hypothetical protein
MGRYIRAFPESAEITHPKGEVNESLVESIKQSARTNEIPKAVVIASKEDVLLACRHALVGRVDDTKLIEHIFEIAIAQTNGRLRQWIAGIGKKSRYASDELKNKLGR